MASKEVARRTRQALERLGVVLEEIGAVNLDPRISEILDRMVEADVREDQGFGATSVTKAWVEKSIARADELASAPEPFEQSKTLTEAFAADEDDEGGPSQTLVENFGSAEQRATARRQRLASERRADGTAASAAAEAEIDELLAELSTDDE